MYKTVTIEHKKGGYDIQRGDTKVLDATIEEWDRGGFDLVSVTTYPHLVDAGRVGFLLVFKLRDTLK